MCTRNEFNDLINCVAINSKEIFKEKLNSAILFGSYARGDYDEESDVDIIVLVDMPAESLNEYHNKIAKLCGALLYEYGVVVSIVLRDTQTFNRYSDVLPFYQNIKKEGIKVA